LMAALEERVLGRARPDRPLAERVRDFASALLGLRERQYLGRERQGAFGERIRVLSNAILGKLEERYGERPRDLDVPDRVTQLRRRIIKLTEGLPPADPQRGQCQTDMSDLVVVTQLYSYTHDYDLGPLAPERV